VILNLSVWFALHVIFADITPGRFGPRVDLSSLLPQSLVLTVVAGLLLLVLRLPLMVVLALMAGVAAAAEFLI